VEKVIYEGRMSLKSQIRSLIIAAFFSLVGLASLTIEPSVGITIVFIACLVFVGGPYLRVLSSAYKVTTERASQRAGLIARNTSEIEVGDIRNVQVRQGAIDRILKIGNVGISTAGQSGFEITFAGVPDPQAVAELVRNARRGTEKSPLNRESEK
jgi:uncharacterized membrane protein YdbT with pleckstrin-like domain